MARKALSSLADETGGRAFFLDGVEGLQAIYDAIEEELRSRFLLAYQSSNTATDGKFRSVDVRLAQPGLEPRTMRGYYP
jgi:VWFA-related protein